MRRIIPSLTLLTIMLAAPAWAVSFNEAKSKVDPQSHYLFYLHGAIMETQGKTASSPQYGTYLYDSIIEHFEDRGLTVIEEVRTKTNPNQYASRITMQIRQLLAAGVPANNITVVGFSKGGYISLLVASSLGNPDIGYAILAGCGKGRDAFAFDQFLKKSGVHASRAASFPSTPAAIS